jgi:hypothetical protein
MLDDADRDEVDGADEVDDLDELDGLGESQPDKKKSRTHDR